MTVLYQAPRLLFFLLTAYVIYVAWGDWTAGGNSWKQGDWLINSIETTVRRGYLGSVLIQSAEVLGLSPVTLVVILQTAMVAGSAILIALAIWPMVPRYTLWLLVIGPGFFLRFWALDVQGGLRKETIAFFGFSILLYAALRAGRAGGLAWLASVLLSVALIGHEGVVFLVPFFFACLYMMAEAGRLGRSNALAMAGLVAAASLAAVGMAVLFRNVVDHILVCQPLLEAGEAATICDGAIKALETPLSEFVHTTFWMALSPRVLSFATLVVLNSAFVIAIGGYLIGWRRFALPFLASAFLFLPLFIVAVDWGRWVSFHNTAVVFVLLMALGLGQVTRLRDSEMPAWAFAGLLAFTLIWGFSHFLDVLWGGPVRAVLQGAGAA